MKTLVVVVEVDPNKVSGTPVFAGTRVPVKNLFDYLKGGDNLEDFLEGFPPVTREQAIEVLAKAGRSLLKNWREPKVLLDHNLDRRLRSHFEQSKIHRLIVAFI